MALNFAARLEASRQSSQSSFINQLLRLCKSTHNLSLHNPIKMPLIDVEAPPTSTDAHYVVYFASPENGQSSWCPDCRNALPALKNVFGADSAPSAYVIQAGTRAEWRGNPNNKWRNAPYNIDCLPTIVRVENVS